MTGPARPWRATTCELFAKIIAESELLQPALNEIHKFCFQHWSRGRGTCGTGSGAPVPYFSSSYLSFAKVVVKLDIHTMFAATLFTMLYRLDKIGQEGWRNRDRETASKIGS